MKKLLIVFLIGTIVLGVGCGKQVSKLNNNVETKHESVEDTKDKTTEESKVETKKTMTVAELEEALNNQPMKIISTEYVVQDPELKALYPDMLVTVFQNNSGTDIKSVKLGFVAWDSNNFPVKILDKYEQGDYYIQTNYSDVNMVNGATYGEDYGSAVSENSKIAKFKAIIASYTDFDGNTWDNPLLDDFKDLYMDKKLVE